MPTEMEPDYIITNLAIFFNKTLKGLILYFLTFSNQLCNSETKSATTGSGQRE